MFDDEFLKSKENPNFKKLESGIVMERCQNQNVLVLHCPFKLEGRVIDLTTGPPDNRQNKARDFEKYLGETISDIQGVVNVVVKKYSLKVEKGTAFSWAGIVSNIISILKDSEESIR